MGHPEDFGTDPKIVHLFYHYLLTSSQALVTVTALDL